MELGVASMGGTWRSPGGKWHTNWQNRAKLRKYLRTFAFATTPPSTRLQPNTRRPHLTCQRWTTCGFLVHLGQGSLPLSTMSTPGPSRRVLPNGGAGTTPRTRDTATSSSTTSICVGGKRSFSKIGLTYSGKKTHSYHLIVIHIILWSFISF